MVRTSHDGAPGAGPADETEQAWTALLALADAVRGAPASIGYGSMRVGPHPCAAAGSVVESCPDCRTVVVGLGEAPGVARGHVSYVVDDVIVVGRRSTDALPEPVDRLLRAYLPYCLAPVHAERRRRAFAVSHFAQSLDGRVATVTGDSRWIGSPANLVHAHRMRALCDGILIGANTLRTDRPQLTVRHVAGEDPVRIVLGSATADELRLAGDAPVWLVTSSPAAVGDDVRTLRLEPVGGVIGSAAVLDALYREGIRSVYVEGGAATTSRFLRDGALDVVQLHLAPTIFGSGVSAFSLDPIRDPAESIRFAAYDFLPVGDDVMFVGTAPAPAGGAARDR